ncbi:MAG: carboxypeptidase-like regulatory domain-containing protein [Bryobacteraceae bacterium]
MKPWLVVIALMAFLPLSAAEPQKTSIRVNVKDQYEKPIDNATVILDFLGSRQIAKLGKRRQTHWEVHTNQEGLAHFPPVPQGTIQLQVVAKNHQTFGKKFDIDTDQKAIDVQLNPPQEQYTANPSPK